MENNDFSIDKKIRGILNFDKRFNRISLGILVLIIGLILIGSNGFSFHKGVSIIHATCIFFGIILIIYGWIGRELYTIRYRLKIDSESMSIKKTFESEILVKLNLITRMKILQMKLEISFKHYTETYDFSWLTREEFEKLRVWISDFCVNKKIEIE